MNEALRIVVVAPDLDVADPHDDDALAQAERSRSLRIGLLESGFNLVATLPGDVFLSERLTQLQQDLVIVDADREARDALEHVVMATGDARRTPQMEAFRQGRRVLVQEAQGGPLAGLPNLPKAIDAASTVNYIRAVLGGQLPVPAPIARQVEHILLETSAS